MPYPRDIVCAVWTPTRHRGIVVAVYVLVVLVFVGLLAAQEPAVDTAGLLARLRHTAPTDPSRGVLIDALLDAGGRAPRALFDLLDLDASARQVVCRRQSESLQRNFDRQAHKLLTKRLDTRAKARVEVLRNEIVKRSRGESLTKETITAEIDPRLAELRTLLTVSVDQVLTGSPTLATAVAQFRDDCAALVAVAAQRQRAVSALAAAGQAALIVVQPAPAHAREFDAAVEKLARAATPMTARDAKVLAANELVVLDAQELAGVLILNDIRILVGLPALAIDTKLGDAARDHSVDMVERNFFSHTSPVPGKQSFSQRAARMGTSASGENIAFGQADGRGAITAWWYSPGHHKNMMGDHARIGLGRHQRHWTQLFGG